MTCTCKDACRCAEIEDLQARLAAERRMHAELHYAVRREANILDHKLTVDEAHKAAMDRVARMHAEIDAYDAAARGSKLGRR